MVGWILGKNGRKLRFMGTERGGRLHKVVQKYRCGTLQPGGGSMYTTRGSVLFVKKDQCYYPRVDDYNVFRCDGIS